MQSWWLEFQYPCWIMRWRPCGMRWVPLCFLRTSFLFSQYQFSSVQSLSRVRLCNPMNHITPGLPVHHQFWEFTQTLVHWVSDAIQPSHVTFSFCPQSFLALGSFQMSQFFTSGGQSTGVSASTSVLPVNTQDWSPLEWTGFILKCDW